VNSIPGTAETLALVHGLGAALAEFAGREVRLERDHAARREREDQSFQQALDALETKHTSRIDEANRALQQGTNDARLTYERRANRIRQAFGPSRKRYLERITSREGDRKYKVQVTTMQMNRDHPENLARVDATCQRFGTALDASRDALADLQERADRLFRGYRRLLKRARAAARALPLPASDDEYKMLADIGKELERVRRELEQFRKTPLPRVFRLLPVHMGIALIGVAHVALAVHWHRFGLGWPYCALAGASMAAFAGALAALHHRGRAQVRSAAGAVARGLETCDGLHGLCEADAASRRDRDRDQLEKDYARRREELAAEWEAAAAWADSMRERAPEVMDERLAHATARNEALYHTKVERCHERHARTLARLNADAEQERAKLTAARESAAREADRQYQAAWEKLAADWQSRVPSLYASADAARAAASRQFPGWSAPAWADWTPPPRFLHAVPYAELALDVGELAGSVPRSPRLALPGAPRFSLPLCLAYPAQGSILLESWGPARDRVAATLNNIILRLLTSAPPGKLSFTVVDPVGLGQNFAGIMHLADYEESLVNDRIWTQPRQIEQELADLTEHMEKVIQMYLRNDYQTIAEYNEKAGDIAEKYRFLVVADFPAAFSDVAARRLLSIVASGARCGVYTLMHWDLRQGLPQGMTAEELRSGSVRLEFSAGSVALAGAPATGARLVLETPPEPDTANRILRAVGERSRGSSRIEVPFSCVAPAEQDLWSGDTAAEIRVSIGRTGATKLQALALGDGTRQHAVIVGKTGSGKSTLFHVMITNLALWFEPGQVEFYLVDFKKGVEFRCYARHRLPHARVVAIESEREFGLSVLQRVDAELHRRGEIFRNLGVQDIRGYRKSGGGEVLPRTLLIVDEFQEFFVHDDRIAQNAALLLDRIVRQGRAFGIHVLLGSQTLGGAYTLARTTLGQMVVRIALQCNEADSHLIMEEGNPAPRLLSRPGEAIYNDAAGALEGNSPFQVVWLPEDERDRWLAAVRARAEAHGLGEREPIVFEGNAPASIEENRLLRNLLRAETLAGAPAPPRIWLGAPNSIKGPTEVAFPRQGGRNLLIVGQGDEATSAVIAVSLVALAAQHARGSARFVLFDGAPPDSAQALLLDRIVAAIPQHPITRTKADGIGDVMTSLAQELEGRAASEDSARAPAIYVFLHGLQRLKKLRFEDEFSYSLDERDAAPSPGAQFQRLLAEGAHVGIHVIAAVDTFADANRLLGRKALAEFELRMVFQMSAADSASLIDSTDASNLGLYRAILYNEREGQLETFRPYAPPTVEWIEDAARHLSRLLA